MKKWVLVSLVLGSLLFSGCSLLDRLAPVSRGAQPSPSPAVAASPAPAASPTAQPSPSGGSPSTSPKPAASSTPAASSAPRAAAPVKATPKPAAAKPAATVAPAKPTATATATPTPDPLACNREPKILGPWFSKTFQVDARGGVAHLSVRFGDDPTEYNLLIRDQRVEVFGAVSANAYLWADCKDPTLARTSMEAHRARSIAAGVKTTEVVPLSPNFGIKILK